MKNIVQYAYLGCFLAALAVALGAFAAHGLRARLEPRQLEIFQTGVTYQFYHAIGLLALAACAAQVSSSQIHLLNYAMWCFLLGIVFFSGSLYVLSTRSLTGLEALTPVMGPITPIGGLLFIVGWVIAGYSFFTQK